MNGTKNTAAPGHRSIRTISTCALLAFILLCLASVDIKADDLQNHAALEIYLPREVTIKDDVITLGQVGIIRGGGSLAAKAGGISLGRISVPGQKITIDRQMVLSRLACSGIAGSKVKLTGAEKIKVKQQWEIVKGSKFVELARTFLKKNPSYNPDCELEPLRMPADWFVSEVNKDFKLLPRLAGHKVPLRNQAKVEITVVADGAKIASREVTFRLKYNCRKAIAKVDIPKGALISAENVRIEKSISNYPEPANWKGPYGLVARRRIAANTEIRPGMAGQIEPAVIIKRNETVIIRIESPMLLITAVGRAKQNGRAGDYIRVQNVDSQRIITAKVNEDGTVRPIF